MAKVKKTTSEEPKSFRPALTPEARENQIISLAMNTAEQRIRDNTASDTLICHFLKLGTSKYQLELEKRQAEAKAVEDSKSDIGWGSQIRSYVLDDARIKDLRTGVENRDTQKVLNGDLDQFIEASLKSGL